MEILKNFRIAPKFFFALQQIYKKTEQKLFLEKKNFVPENIFVSLKKNYFWNFMKWGLKGGFQLMLILGFLGMYFDAAVVFVTKS